MLSLYTSGYNYSKKRCEKIVNWFIQKELPRYKLDIIVNHRGMMRDEVYGWVGVIDCDHRPRAFEIEMHNRLSPEHYTVVLLHELWHINQHVKGALRDKYGKRHWRGIDHSHLDYSDQPWEQQAFIMEKVLYEEYLNYLTDTQQSL
jgi:hypothetical protein